MLPGFFLEIERLMAFGGKPVDNCFISQGGFDNCWFLNFKLMKLVKSLEELN
jgi:hypothetical protein